MPNARRYESGMIKYYKKYTPQTKVRLSNGNEIQFSTVDGIIGYFATDSDYVQKEFERCMAENRYAISEISEREHVEDYRKKKAVSTTSRQLFGREELVGLKIKGHDPIQTLGADQVAKLADVSSVSAKPINMPVPSPAPVTVAEGAGTVTQQTFQPVTGKRKTRQNQTPTQASL
jgi:hypothetical protein